jgi:kynurenine formamidase
LPGRGPSGRRTGGGRRWRRPSQLETVEKLHDTGGWDDDDPGVPAHRELLGAGRVIVENLVLTDVPDRFRLVAYPLRIVDGDASPVRAVADW